MRGSLGSIPSVDGLSDVALLGTLCGGAECTNLVQQQRRFCDPCTTTAAIELARMWETSVRQATVLIGDDPETCRPELQAALAGIATTRPVAWYQANSPLGRLSYAEALDLRSRTDEACRRVAEGGVAALDPMLQPARPVAKPSVRPAHYIGQPFGASVWDDCEIKGGVGDGFVSPGRRVLTIVLAALGGAATLAALLVAVIWVLLW